MRRWRADAALAGALLAAGVAVGLSSVAAVNAQQVLSGEEVSVSFLDVVAVTGRFQPTRYATNFGGHVHFWIFSHLDPSFDLFYGRTGKALAMALLAPVVYYTLRRRLSCGRPAAALGAAVTIVLPGVSALAWLATENGLEALWGMAGLLLATARRRVWVLATVPAGVAVSAYGAGLAWAGALGLVVVLRLARGERRWRDIAAVGAATAGGLAVVLFPLVWWRDGGRILVGGGSVGSAHPLAALQGLVDELAVRGGSYYYFTASPALGSLWLAVVLAAATVLATARRPEFWPWVVAVVLTVALYAGSGGVLGVRRTIALPVVAAMGLAVALDVLARCLAIRSAALAGAAVAVVAVAVLVPLGLQQLGNRSSWESGRYALPRDFAFPMEPGTTMPEEVAILTTQLNSGAITYQAVAAQREGERSLAMVWLMAVRNGRDLTGLATPPQIAHLVSEGPRCTHGCRPVPGRP